MVIVVGGCKTPDRALRSSGITPQAMPLEIDLVSATARSDRWTTTARDCSTQNFTCIDVVGHFIIAFPRKCIDMSEFSQAKSLPLGLKIVALDAHYSLPDASYTLHDAPDILLFYKRSLGFYEVRELLVDTNQANFDPNNFSARYSLRTPSGIGLAKCE